MLRSMKTLAAAVALVAGLAAAPALYAHDPSDSDGSMMGPGMMQHDRMMGMMRQMSQMMENCNEMMQSMMGEQGSQKPDERRRGNERETDKAPEENR